MLRTHGSRRFVCQLLGWLLLGGVACTDSGASGEAVAAEASEQRAQVMPQGGSSAPELEPADTRLAEPLLEAMDLVAQKSFAEADTVVEAYAATAAALDYQAEFMRGYVCHKAQRFAAAREHFERALTLAPDYHPTWHFLGLACHALGDLDRAEVAFREHARQMPGDGDDAFGLGLVALERDALDVAETELKRALKLHGQAAAQGVDRRRELAKVYARLGDVHARRGHWGSARDALVRAVQQFGGHDEIWHKLSQAHLRLGEHERAAEALAARDTLRARQNGGR
ncbi:MAG: tetratricopeptide (TPR) repeat protein [Pseudohongiellaceae bacterium]|jgi:tetratricopeptide (TPR) repeat protein